MKGFLPMLLFCALLVFPSAASAASVHPAFSDTAGHPAERDIQLVDNLGIMVGTGTDANGAAIFAPSAMVSKAQLAVVLQRTFQLDYDLSTHMMDVRLTGMIRSLRPGPGQRRN